MENIKTNIRKIKLICTHCHKEKKKLYKNGRCIDCNRKYKLKYKKTDNIEEFKKCLICNNKFIGNRGLITHLRYEHKITPKEYYDKFFKKENEGICYCGNKTKFKKLSLGYYVFCSTKCTNNNKEIKLKKEKTLFENYGVTHSSRIKKIRINSSKRMANKIEKDPNTFIIYNKIACEKIDNYGKENGYNFQHALNGGEIRVFNYFLDGYDSIKNVAIEYYEKHHKYRQKYDNKRIKKIINKLNCKFIILHETGKTEII